jgi:hypothetical protein
MDLDTTAITTKEIEKRIDFITTKKGIVSNEEIQELVKLRAELSYRIFFQ